jgi:hypothetical protein
LLKPISNVSEKRSDGIVAVEKRFFERIIELVDRLET